jgi:uncharacterized SAM-binding protein YcdF (DUF218 family)
LAAFAYSLLLALLSPASVILILLVLATFAGTASRMRRSASALALVILLVCGNGWVVHAIVGSLESAYQPLAAGQTADAIVVLGGGTLARIPPRQSVEVTDAGDRVLYAGELFRQRRAPKVFVTGDVATGGIAPRPVADDMAELLGRVGVPRSAIIAERRAQNTHDHAVYLCPMFASTGVRRVLLVTSAIHMRRSVEVFRRTCPAVESVVAPTDYRIVADLPGPWYRSVANLIPTPYALVEFTDAVHEYVGIAYYHLRGWS